MKKIFLKPKEIYCDKEPSVVSTILGSCVAVCVFDKKLKFGGINHFVLPSENDEKMRANPYRYGKSSIISLLAMMKKMGSHKEDLVAKIIGGASVQLDFQNSSIHVGAENIAVAKMMLRKFGIKIVGENTGGNLGRKIEFNTGTGEVRFQFIKNTTKEYLNPLITQDTKIKANSIKVLIVDDSKPIRLILKSIISKDSRFEIVGEAQDPFEAIEIQKKIKPDVITLDLNMPRMDGVTYLKEYLSKDKIPTVIITDYNIESSSIVFEALEAGAFDYIKKPSLGEMEQYSSTILDTLKTAYESRNKLNFYRKIHKNFRIEDKKDRIQEWAINNYIIVIGASTGGTEAIKDVLVNLPAKIPPILIVQHIPPVFSKEFAKRLNSLCPFEVKEAQDKEKIKPNCVYIAPGGWQMKIIEKYPDYIINVTDDPPVNRFKPSVDYLFLSACKINHKKILGIILTGMGKDGAEGLRALKDKGSITIAQDEQSSVVWGMPKAAVELGCIDYVLSLDKIASHIVNILNKKFQTPKAINA